MNKTTKYRPDPALRRAAVFWATWLGLVVCLVAMRGLYLAWNWDLLHDLPVRKLLEAFVVGLRFDASAAAFVCAALLPLALIHLGQRASRWRWNLYTVLLLVMT